MKETPRRVGRILFALAGAGSAVFVHFLPAPGPSAPGSRSGSPPAVVSAPALHDPPAPATVPFAPRRLRAEGGEAAPAASPVLAVDGSAASDPPVAHTR